MHITHSKSRIVLLMFVCASALTSCSWSDPARVESDFGDSVRNMIEQQKAPVPASLRVDRLPALDGESALNSLDSYRMSQKKRTSRKPLESLAPTR